jgi:Uma2 family endonuclease
MSATPTYADLLAAPENMVAELIDGELYTTLLRGPHRSAMTCLGALICAAFDLGHGGPGGWRIVSQPEIHFGPSVDEQVAVPDVCGWTRKRMPDVPEDHRYRVVPDWICEMISLDTGRLDRAVKMPLYAKHGVAHAWIIDPEQRTLEVFRLRAGHLWEVTGAYSREERVRAEPFEAVALNLKDLWV